MRSLYEKLNRLDDSLVESEKVVKKKKLTESTNRVKLEVKYETYGRYGDGGDIKRGRVSGSTEVEALMKMLDHVHMYIDSDYAEEFKEEEGRYPTTEEVLTTLYQENGDGCDLIYWIRNLTTGEMIFDSAVEESEPEEWDDDIDEMLTEEQLPESKDTDYVIMFTNNDKHLFFIDPDKFTSNVEKATIYPGKFSAEHDIKYAIDAAQGNLIGIDDYVEDLFSAISVKEAKSISVNNAESSIDITAKPGREYIIVLEGGGYNQEFWDNQKQKWTNNLSKATRFMTLLAAKDAVRVCWHKIRTGSDEHLKTYAKIRIIAAPQKETGTREDYIKVAEKYGFRGTQFYKQGPRIPTLMSLTIGESTYDIMFNGQTVNASARIVGKDIDTTVFTVEDLENVLSSRFSKVTKVNDSDTQLKAVKQTIQSYASKNNVSKGDLKDMLKKMLTELE